MNGTQKFLISIPSITLSPALRKIKKKKDSADLLCSFFSPFGGVVKSRYRRERSHRNIEDGSNRRLGSLKKEVAEDGKKQKKKGEKEWGLVRRARSWDHRQCMLPA